VHVEFEAPEFGTVQFAELDEFDVGALEVAAA
jgi:hypothetical protein